MQSLCQKTIWHIDNTVNNNNYIKLRKMKKIIYSLFSLCALIAMVSCDEEWNAEELMKSENGLLSVSQLCVDGVENADVSSYVVEISNADGQSMGQWTGADFPLDVELEAGAYVLSASSSESVEPVWEQAFYAGTKAFKIEEGKRHVIDCVDCSVASVSVTVAYDEEVADLVNDNATVEMSIAGKQLEFAKNESRVAHFYLADGASTAVAKFSGVVKGDSVVYRKVLTNLVAGDSLNLVFGVKELVNKKDPNDPGAPKATSCTLDLNGVNVITEGLQAKVDISAAYGIRNLYVEIFSEQLNKAMLQEIGLDSSFDLANPGAMADVLTELGFPVGDAVVDKTQIEFDITEFMPLLAMFPGQHSFVLTVIDNEDLSTVVTLAFEVPEIVIGEAPVITSSTLDLNGVNVITEDLKAKIDIVAENGIANLNVKIISEILTKEMLQEVGLDSEFDLANPGDLAEVLGELGFPVGDAVVGKTELLFDITDFMPLLAIFPGQHDFELTVVDAQGLSTVATLKFEAVAEEVVGAAPVITSTTLNLEGVNVITEGLKAKVDIVAENGIANLKVKIISEMLTKEMLQEVGLDSEFDLANPGDLAEVLGELGFPVGDAVVGKTELLFDITDFMPLLAIFPGQHDFELTVVDAQGLSTVATLKFEAVAEEVVGAAPVITSTTLNLEGVNVITEGLKAKVDIVAENGIANLKVKIISEMLTKEMLQEVGLDSEFDLANPGDLAEVLGELGFPVGEAVVGKTELLFNITDFMPLLAMFPGQHDFELTVVDAADLSTTKTLKFQSVTE